MDFHIFSQSILVDSILLYHSGDGIGETTWKPLDIAVVLLGKEGFASVACRTCLEILEEFLEDGLQKVVSIPGQHDI